jgi:hypothetical protein
LAVTDLVETEEDEQEQQAIQEAAGALVLSSAEAPADEGNSFGAMLLAARVAKEEERRSLKTRVERVIARLADPVLVGVLALVQTGKVATSSAALLMEAEELATQAKLKAQASSRSRKKTAAAEVSLRSHFASSRRDPRLAAFVQLLALCPTAVAALVGGGGGALLLAEVEHAANGEEVSARRARNQRLADGDTNSIAAVDGDHRAASAHLLRLMRAVSNLCSYRTFASALNRHAGDADPVKIKAMHEQRKRERAQQRAAKRKEEAEKKAAVTSNAR